jgi:hypothetical protein
VGVLAIVVAFPALARFDAERDAIGVREPAAA